MSETMKSGAGLIADERRRQIEAEGYTLEHDDAEKPGALALAAIAYATCAASSPNIRYAFRAHADAGQRLQYWPDDWEASAFKPSRDDSADSRIRELTKAGALIAAEIDRLQRAKATAP